MFLPLIHRSDRLKALVVGAGNVARRKVADLVDAGVETEIIARQCSNDDLREFINRENIPFHERDYREGDVQGFDLVIVATNDKELNALISKEARKRGVPVNVVDQPDFCSVYFSAVVRRDPLILSVSTGGAAPFFARDIKKELAKWIDDNKWDIRAKWAEKIRRFALDNIPVPGHREAFFRKFMQLSSEELEQWDFENPPVGLWKSWINNG